VVQQQSEPAGARTVGQAPSWTLFNVLGEAGKFAESYDVVQQIVPSEALPHAPPFNRCRYGIAAARAGDTAIATRIAHELANVAQTEPWGDDVICRGRLAAALGDRAEAVRLIRIGIMNGAPVQTLHASLVLSSLVGYPPFDSLLVGRGNDAPRSGRRRTPSS
jgi:hypothetical protein